MSVNNLAPEKNSGGMNIGNVSGDFSLQAGGDIVAGNKTIIQNFFPTKEKIITAPYKFLSSYDISDKDIFFGRSKVINTLSEKIARHKIVVINGRSGSGKTSLINAGLIPRLANDGYFFVSFKEYFDPVKQLRDYIKKDENLNCITNQNNFEDMSFLDLLTFIKSNQNKSMVIIFDQFERFFVSVKEKVRNAFIKELKACMYGNLSAKDMNIVISLREDYFGILMREFETVMPEFFNESFRFHLHPLNIEEAKEAIMSPLIKHKFDLSYKKEFVEKILIPALMGETSGEEKVDPPQLQIVCNQLYEEGKTFYKQQIEEEGSAKIDEALYHQLGKASGILRDYLDDFIDRAVQHDSQAKNSLRSMLKLMIESGGTRKFISNSQLCQGLPDVDPDMIIYYVKKLQDGRVIETREQDGLSTYSLSHEFMVEKVRSWFDEREMERKKSRETLDRGLAEWNSTRSFLSEKQVKKIHKWIKEELNDEEKRLLERSHEYHNTRKLKEEINEKSLQFRKKIIWGAVILIFIVIALFIWQTENNKIIRHEKQIAENERKEAQKQANIAEIERKRAEKQKIIADEQRYLADKNAKIARKARITSRSHELASYAINIKDFDPVLSFRLAEAAYYITPTMQANKGIISPLMLPLYNRIHTTDTIHSTFFSPCGKKIIIQFQEHIEIWDVYTGKKLHEVLGFNEWIKRSLYKKTKLPVIRLNNDIHIVDIESGTSTPVLKTNALIKRINKIKKAMTSPDGRYIAFKSESNIIWIWDIEKKEIHTLNEHEITVSNILFDTSGKFMVSTNKRAIIWDTTNWKVSGTYNKHIKPIQHIRLFKDNKVITSDSNGSIKIWNLNDCKEISNYTHDKKVFDEIELSHNEKYLAVSVEDTALVWNIEKELLTTNPIRLLHSNYVEDIKFSRDEKYLITASHESIIWDLKTKQEKYRLTGHMESIIQADPSPTDDNIIMTTTINDGIRIWNTDIYALNSDRNFEEELLSAEFAANDQYIIINTEWSSNIFVLMSDSLSLKEGINNVKKYFMPPAKDYLTVYKSDGSIHSINLKSDERGLFHQLKTDSKDIALSSNAKILYLSSDTDNSVFSHDNSMLLSILSEYRHRQHANLPEIINKNLPRIIDVETNEVICHLKDTNSISYKKSIFSPNDTYILTLMNKELFKDLFTEKKAAYQLRLWEASTCCNYYAPRIKTAEQMINNAYFSPDENLLITTSFDKGRVYDIKKRRLKYLITEHKNSIHNVSFSSDSQYMATTSTSEMNQIDELNSDLIIWDLKTGMPVHQFSEKTKIKSISFSKDSSRILLCSNNGISIRIIDPELAIKKINHRKRGIVRELTPQEIQRYDFSKDDLIKLCQKVLSHHQNDINIHFQWIVVFLLHQMEKDADTLFNTALQKFGENKGQILNQFFLVQKEYDDRNVSSFFHEKSMAIK